MELNVIVQESNPAKEKILLLSQKAGLTWSEIAKLTGIKKKVIKCIAKGDLFSGNETGICQMLDTTIERLNIHAEQEPEEPSSDVDIDIEDYQLYKLDVKSVTIYKGTADDKMIVQIHGDIMK